nr:class I SAM-dependent methyltransferase [uncultured Mucilaginibacter sp.]
MANPIINREFGREAFGNDTENYHAARPAYPAWVYEKLRPYCKPGTATFEVGAGTGLATSHLLDMGAKPLIAIEPDKRMADYLSNTLKHEALTVVALPFEDAELPQNAFDLGVCATAFHWLDEDAALQKVAKLLRPGGCWAMLWNVFGDNKRADPFHEATKTLLSGASSPGEGTGPIPFGLDYQSRIAGLERAGTFDNIQHYITDWELVLNPKEVVALYGSYSNINIRKDRDEVLAELEQIARVAFNGRVIRNMSTSLYLARRK